MAFEKYKPQGLFSEFYGIEIKSEKSLSCVLNQNGNVTKREWFATFAMITATVSLNETK